MLSLNSVMFLVEFTVGWIADSSGLLADSLDMLADTAVYLVSLYAVGRSLRHKAKAALFNGGLQFTLGFLVLANVFKRIWLGSDPQTDLMMSVAVVALLVNVTCFVLFYRLRKGDINLRASWICSRNDMLANVGVISAAGLVAWLEAPWPDWVIGALIACVVVHSAWRIIRKARQSIRTGILAEKSCCG